MMVRLPVVVGTLAFALVSAGCMKGSYAEVAYRSPEAIKQLPNHDVVAVYGVECAYPSLLKDNKSKFRAEIERRHLFNDDQWQMIDAKQIRIGEPELLVWASWGKPDRIDSLTTADGERRGLVYDDSVSIVYIERGKVAAILD